MSQALAAVLSLLIVVTAAAGSARCSLTRAGRRTPCVRPRTSKMLQMDRRSIEKLVELIERSEEPTPVMGAMCYRMAPPPVAVEYVCPACGERTLYPTGYGRMVVEDLEECRLLMAELDSISGMGMSLDESSLCSVCGTDGDETVLVLRVSLDDGTSASSAITSSDLRMLYAFLSGDLAFETAYDGREPLKPYLLRIRSLLGVLCDSTAAVPGQQSLEVTEP